MNSRKTLLNLTVNFLKFSFDGIGYCQSAVDPIILFFGKNRIKAPTLLFVLNKSVKSRLLLQKVVGCST